MARRASLYLLRPVSEGHEYMLNEGTAGSTCVGRESELALLRARYDEASKAGERLVVVRGAPGVGKTRLFAEFRSRMRLDGAVVLEGRCAQGGRAYGPFVEILRSALQFLKEVGAPSSEVGPLAAVLGGDRSDADPVDDVDRRVRFFDAYASVLRRVARVRTPVVLLHDVHLADTGSLELLHHLVDGNGPLLDEVRPDARLRALFVASVRTEEGDANRIGVLSAHANASTLELGGLSTAGLLDWVRSPLFLERLLSLTGGTPEEVEALLATRPASGEDRLRARIEPLGSGARGLLEALSVWNRAVSPDALAAVGGRTGTLAADVSELVDTGAVSRAIVDGEMRLAWAKGADRDHHYAMMPEPRRRKLHGAVCRRLSEDGSSGLAAQDLAYHALRSEEPREGVGWAIEAADALMLAYGYEAAARLLEDAIEVAAPRGEALGAVLERLAAAHRASGSYKRALEHAEQFAVLRPKDPAAHRRVGEVHRLLGDYRAAAEKLETAGRLARDAADERMLAEIAADMAEVLYRTGDHDAATSLVGEGLAHADRADAVAPRWHLQNTLGKLRLAKADYDAAASIFEENLALARAAVPSEEAGATVNLAIVEFRRQRYDVARELFERGAAMAGERGSLLLQALCRENLAVLAHWRRDYTQALDHYHEAVGLLKRLGNRPFLARIANNLGELYLHLGDATRARHLADFAQSLIAGANDEPRAVRAGNFLLRGQIESSLAQNEAARLAAAAALDLYREIGATERMAEATALLARLHLADGDVAAAGRFASAAPASDAPRALADVAAVRAEVERAAGRDPLPQALTALDLYDRDGDDEGRWRASLAIARALLDRGDAAGAGKHLRAAIRVDEALRARVPDAFRASYATIPERVLLSRLIESLPEEGRASTSPSGPSGPGPSADSRLRTWQDRYPDFIGSGERMRSVYALLDRVAGTDSLVLIRGESGTGKELAAAALHRHSPRRTGPFVKVNCAALVETLLLSELFGHERGAFTGAMQRRKGRFEAADGGTIFLDEIGDISTKAQVALLRVLQERCFERVGGTTPIHVDVRILCATNRDLETMVEHGEFREDLYYRLKGIAVDMPALRDRSEDLAPLAQHFLGKFAAERGEPAKTATDAAIVALARHDWPGNVRELENVLRSVSLFVDGPALDAPHLEAHAAAFTPRGVAPQGDGEDEVYERVLGGTVSLADLKKEIERECIVRALKEAEGNITRAAAMLGMKRPRLSQLVKQYALSAEKAGGRS